MTIKIGEKLEKLDPADTYKLIDGADVEGFDTLKTQVDQHEQDKNAIDSRIGTAEQHLQTLQQDGVAIGARVTATNAIATGNTAAIQQLDQSVRADMQVMQSNIAQKISGIHVEDVHNNAFDDITALHFTGATLTDEHGGNVNIVIDPTINVSNGQSAGATNYNVKGVEFPGATITQRDPSGANIAVVALTSPPPPVSGVSITDGTTTVSDMKTLTVKGKVEDNGSGAAEFLPGIDMSQQFGDYKMLDGIFEIDTKWPIEVHETFNSPNVVTPGVAVLAIDPRAYEYQHGPSTLLQADADISIGGQKAQAIYLPQEIIPTGTYMSLNPVKKGLNVQDSSGNDTLLTGGQLTEILANVAFTGNAPENGTIKAWIEYQDASGTLPAGVLVDVNGAPMLVEQAYYGGDELRPLVLWGAMRAKIEAPIMLMIQTSFGASDIVVLDAERTLLCVNQFTRGYETSLARIEFQRRTGFSLTPIIHQFTGPWASLKSELEGVTQAFTTLPAGAGYDVLNQFGVQNLTTVAARIQNGTLGVHGNGVPADFYIDYISDNTRTRMLRGRNVQAVIKMANRNAAFRLELYSWGGSPDKATPIYDTRTNTAIDVKPSWTLVKSVAIPENASGAAVEYTVTGTIPTSAQNFAVIIRPEVPVDPCSMDLSGFTVEAVDVFTGYAEIGQINTAETHLAESDVYAEFGTTAAGYAAIRYTIGTTAAGGYPMPIGKQMKGAAPIKLNNALNRVGGSQVPQYDGVLQYDADGEVQQSVTYLLRNEGSSPVNVDFWAVLYNVGATEGSETEVAGSRKQYTVPANTKAPGVYVTLPAFSVDVLSGQSIGYRAKGDVAGAYIQSDTSSQYLTQTVVDFKQQTAGGADDPFSGIDMSQFTKAYPAGMTVTKDVANVASVVIPIDIPDDVNVVVLGAIKEMADLTVRPVTKLDWSYSNTQKRLTVSFGETVLVGRVTMGLYL